LRKEVVFRGQGFFGLTGLAGNHKS